MIKFSKEQSEAQENTMRKLIKVTAFVVIIVTALYIHTVFIQPLTS